jgi:hypothetical protein
MAADSDAVRSRRKRAHARGDCSLCRHGPARGAAAAPGVLVALPAPSGAPVDPRVSLERLAARLEAAHEQDPGNAGLAGELRRTLAALSGEDPDAGFDVG